MSKPLSERLYCVARAPGIATNSAYTQVIREAAELARRVEGSAPGRVSGYLPGQMAAEVLMSQDASDLPGKFVRLVPEVDDG